MDKAENQEYRETSLEELFARLDQTAVQMEQGDLPLEDAFSLYRKGMELLKVCSDKIDQVEKKMLVLDEEGETHEF